MDLIKVLEESLPSKSKLVYMIRRKSDGAFKCKATYGERWTKRQGAGAVYQKLDPAMDSARWALRSVIRKGETDTIEIVEFKMTENSTLEVKDA